MATITRKRVVTLPDDLPDDAQQTRGDLTTQDDELPEQTDVDRVGALLQLAGGVGRASVKIYKVDNGKSVFCESYSPQEFEDGDFKMIRDSFGAGVYKIMLYGAHPVTGTFGLLTRTEITLAENRNPSKAVAVQPQNDQLLQVLASIADGQRQLMQAIADNRAPAVDPMAQMRSMLETMTLMKSAMGLDNAQQSQKSSIGEIIEAVRELKAVAGEIAPNDGDGASLVGMLPQVLEVIKTATASRVQQDTTQQPQQTPRAPLPRVQMPQSTPQQPQTVQRAVNPIDQSAYVPTQLQEEHDMRVSQILELKTYMNQLLTMAKQNAPTDAGVDLVFEKLPDEFFAMLALDNWFDGLKAFESGVEPYREWFQLVRDESLREYTAQQEDEPESAAHVEPSETTQVQSAEASEGASGG